MARKPRDLTADEKALWDKVRNNTVPIRSNPEQSVVAAITKLDRPKEKFHIPHFEIGAKSASAPSRQSAQLGSSMPPAVLDAKESRRLKKGKTTPDATLDLHGLTQEQAHPALIGFVMRAYQKGHRLVLVITGKGQDRKKPTGFPAQVGILKRQVPHWLQQPPTGAIVRIITQAHQAHGGEGALYVHLRRPKK